MPELPDITLYIEALEVRILGQRLLAASIASPFVLRTAEPAPSRAVGLRVVALRRLGKRIAIRFETDIWFLMHLMIAGRLHWRDSSASGRSRRTLALFEFESGTLVLTEAGTKKRASLHVLAGAAALREHDPGGLEVLGSELAAFGAALQRENHTLKRALTDPRILSGIGNAYSDEILHRARLSPTALTRSLDDAALRRLHEAAIETLCAWTERLRAQNAGDFPERVTAFRPEMAVHGRFGQPCPDCGTQVQRIRFANHETNYCPRCQTNGKLLADRALSRLLKKDWPKTIEALEQRRPERD